MGEGDFAQEIAERLAEKDLGALALNCETPLQIRELSAYLETKLELTLPGKTLNKKGVLAFGKGAKPALELIKDFPEFFQAAVILSPPAEKFEFVTNVPLLLLWGERNTADPTWLDKIRPRDHRGLVSAISFPGVGNNFFDPASPTYDSKAATQAWSETLAWFNHLR